MAVCKDRADIGTVSRVVCTLAVTRRTYSGSWLISLPTECAAYRSRQQTTNYVIIVLKLALQQYVLFSDLLLSFKYCTLIYLTEQFHTVSSLFRNPGHNHRDSKICMAINPTSRFRNKSLLPCVCNI